jgi:hypothetical protein
VLLLLLMCAFLVPSPRWLLLSLSLPRTQTSSNLFPPLAQAQLWVEALEDFAYAGFEPGMVPGSAAGKSNGLAAQARQATLQSAMATSRRASAGNTSGPSVVAFGSGSGGGEVVDDGDFL